MSAVRTFFNDFFPGVWLVHSALSVSAVEQVDLPRMYVHPLPFGFLPR